MDEATAATLDRLRATRTKREDALAAIAARNGELVARDEDDDQPSPSRNEKKAMRDELIAAERDLHDVHEEIRALEWRDAGIDEGEPQTLHIGEETPS